MGVVQLVENRVLESARNEALARIRDADDWPALALGLQLECANYAELDGTIAAHTKIQRTPSRLRAQV